MWTYDHRADTQAPPSAVWAVLADLAHWAEWDTSLEWTRPSGPLAVGTRFEMKPIGQDPITVTVVAADPERRYADETTFAGVTLRFVHTLESLQGNGTRVVHRLEITGASADEVGPRIGPEITADFPDAMAALLARAETVAASDSTGDSAGGGSGAGAGGLEGATA